VWLIDPGEVAIDLLHVRLPEVGDRFLGQSAGLQTAGGGTQNFPYITELIDEPKKSNSTHTGCVV
jgi:hypothetical protein